MTREIKFNDFDQKSQKEMLERRGRLINTATRKIRECHENISSISDNALYWMDNVPMSEEDKREIADDASANIKSELDLIAKYQEFIKHLEETEPHKLKAFYVMSSFEPKNKINKKLVDK